MSSRTFAWFTCLISVTLCAIQWGQLPTLDAAPRLRVLLFFGMGCCSAGLIFLFPCAKPRTEIWLLLVGAIVARTALLPAPESDDVNRYLWEGKLILEGESPYAAPANDPRFDAYRDHFWEGMNHRDSPTAYPPGIQWIFAGTAWLSYNPLSFKLLALLGDLATLILIMVWLRLDRLPIRWAGFWAFNPVVLISFAAEGHFDSLMSAALVGTILAWRSEKRGLGWILIGIAIQMKFIALVAIAALLTRRSIRSCWLIIPALILPSLPFLSDLVAWWKGVSEFAEGGYFNGPLVSILLLLKMELSTARGVGALVFSLIALGVFLARQRNLSVTAGVMVTMGALLICSPIVHFWYLGWVLPMVCLRPSFGWVAASIASGGYFIAWWMEQETGIWGYGPAVALWIWLLPLFAFLAQNRAIIGQIKSAFRPQRRHTPSLALVIPTLNAGAQLKALADTLRQTCPDATEIIISDGRSTDGSLHDLDATVVTGEPGRGEQIARGIEATNAEWIMIVHADTTPKPSWHSSLMGAIQRHPNASMFVIGQRFLPRSPHTLVIETLNELRVVFGGVAFGDQTMVMRRSALNQAGGFPAQPLMEDVEASLRLRHAGPVIYTGQEWLVSAKKWQRKSAGRFFMIIRLIATYQLVRLRGASHAAALSRRLYKEYYSTGSGPVGEKCIRHLKDHTEES